MLICAVDASKGAEIMVAMKPRTSDGPLEAEPTNRGVTLRIPVEGGGRIVLDMKESDIDELYRVLEDVRKLRGKTFKL